MHCKDKGPCRVVLCFVGCHAVCATLGIVFSLLTYGMAAGGVSVLEPAEVVIMEDNVVYQNKMSGLRIRGTIPVKIISGKIYSNGRAGIYADTDSQMTVTDCDIHDNGRAGINVDRARLTGVENSKIHGNRLAGIQILSEGQGEAEPAAVKITQSRIYNNKQAGIRSMPEADGRVVLSVVGSDVCENQNAGIRVENHTRLTARDNRIYDNGTAGIVAFESAIPPRLDIYQNRIFFNRQAGIHAVNGVTGSIGIRNNWIYNNLRSGIVCGLWSEPNAERLNLEIINNTLVSNGSSDQGAGIRNDSDGRVVIMNNIVAYNYVTGIRAKGCRGYSYNLIFANGDTGNCCDDPHSAPYWIERFQFQGCRERGEQDIICNPRFVNPDKYDFRLQDESPAIDTGKDGDVYNDASFPPSKGTVRNDIGATGGPYALR